MNRQVIIIVFSCLLMAACERQKPTDIPLPQVLTSDANGYYCLMTVINHRGPKGQIILDDRPEALWFTSVRDLIAFTLSPEEPKNIAAIYVNDMSQADWDDPGADNWIDARQAWYVIGSSRQGGMGAAEAVPFSSREKAELFARQYGGRIVDFSSITAADIQTSS